MTFKFCIVGGKLAKGFIGKRNNLNRAGLVELQYNRSYSNILFSRSSLVIEIRASRSSARNQYLKQKFRVTVDGKLGDKARKLDVAIDKKDLVSPPI